MGEKVEGIRSINGRHKNRQGDVKNSMGNGEAKELVCMTHGHELKWQMLVGGGCMAEGNNGKKNMDSCNSIINKIY